jgi:2'-5' RNA ligase
MRLFIGIPLAPAVLSELSAVAARLRSNADGLRWMPSESWHITLQYLGNSDPEQYECLLARLAEVHSRSVPVHLAELGVFDRAGVFFADVSPTPELVSLAGRVASATSLCGFVPEVRPFHPHITLARAKGQGRSQPLRALQQRIHRQPIFPRFVAEAFLLYESHLSPTGSTYEVRHRFQLSPVPSSTP